MADDFNIITDEDKSHLSYGLCVLGHMAAGATLGSIAGGQTLAVAAAGTVWGLFTCRYLAEPIKRKLFSRNERLSDQEFKQTLLAASREFPMATRAQLLDLIGSARLEASRFPSRYRS